jgi:Na+/H+ antiporter NhaD/arsenite permease-like protein
MMTFSRSIVDYLVPFAFVLALVFPAAYSFSRWRSTLPGKAMMTFSVIIALTMGLATWRTFTGDLAPAWIRTASYFLIVGALAMMDVVLLREQSKDRAQHRREGWKVDQH